MAILGRDGIIKTVNYSLTLVGILLRLGITPPPSPSDAKPFFLSAPCNLL